MEHVAEPDIVSEYGTWTEHDSNEFYRRAVSFQVVNKPLFASTNVLQLYQVVMRQNCIHSLLHRTQVAKKKKKKKNINAGLINTIHLRTVFLI